jgi:hypothetical protein
MARQGLRWQHGGPTGLPCRLHWRMRRGEAWLGQAGRCQARQGWAWCGPQTVARRLRPPCHPHKGWARPGAAGYVVAGRAHARHGRAWQGLQTAARSFCGGSLLLSFEGRRGTLGRGWAMLGQAWRGRDWRGKARAASGGKARRGNPPFPVLPSLESGSRQAADTDQ